MAENLAGLTPGGADATYKWLAHFGAPGALPEDGDTPQPLYKGDGTPTPISVTETKLFVNGVDVLALIGQNLRVWNPTTSSYYVLTLTGAAGEEILSYEPEP